MFVVPIEAAEGRPAPLGKAGSEFTAEGAEASEGVLAVG